MLLEECEVLSNKTLASGLYEMKLEGPGICAQGRPGQFVNILVNPSDTPLLRRPMSIAHVNGTTFGLIYKVFGPGTLEMSSWQPGHMADILGPLGNGWWPTDDRLPLLVGGGVGIAPINFLHQQLSQAGAPHQLIMGARSGAEHFLEHDPSAGVTLTTDDGSAGIAGTVIDGLKAAISRQDNQAVTVLGCGPPGMLRALQAFALSHELPCQLAVEEMMGCGVGICMGCSVECRIDASLAQAGKGRRYRLACLDGPVFSAGELVLPRD